MLITLDGLPDDLADMLKSYCQGLDNPFPYTSPSRKLKGTSYEDAWMELSSILEALFPLPKEGPIFLQRSPLSVWKEKGYPLVSLRILSKCFWDKYDEVIHIIYSSEDDPWDEVALHLTDKIVDSSVNARIHYIKTSGKDLTTLFHETLEVLPSTF